MLKQKTTRKRDDKRTVGKEENLFNESKIYPATSVLPEYYEVLGIVLEEAPDTPPEDRSYAYKNELAPGKAPGFGPLYRTSKDELRVPERYRGKD